MNEIDRRAIISQYLEEVSKHFYTGHAREHTYRPALERLMMSFDKVHAVNEPKHSEHGAPDFVFLSDNNNDLILGYAEAKDIDVSLDKTEMTEQMTRYGGYANLFLTDYLEFRFFRNGDKYETISLGEIKDDKLHKTPENGERLMRELGAFLEQTPEQIKNGKRLAQIMGGKARRIRDNVAAYLKNDDEYSEELVKIFEMMKKMLVHDLTEDKFADMYAQTLVYGLFVARYGDKTPDTFTRSEARDLVPKSNPFLRHFFDHIVGPDFDMRLGYIVDELCEIFLVSNVNEIVHKHLRIADDTTDIKDPIIHFYEDFLQEYDPKVRKEMGAYYTPIPVVQFIVRQVDKILKEEFGIAKGLASDETIQHEVEVGQDMRADRRQKANTKQILTIPRVQVLDPAVGTATFLNETIKFVHKSFTGQEGRWPAHVNDSLLKRLYGFELMMAPYTIAHLKLSMTLQETGVDKLNERLNVFLTNTLEEGIPQQSSLFDFGLAAAVSEESRLAAEVKSEKPVMVVMGNPPYSGHSSNNTKYANALVDKYKVEPGGQSKLKEKNAKWINDDYVKFIAFAEDMIKKNNDGILAMITNHGYIDNPTFRGMRWHLAKTFDNIYIVDLHGNSLKNETTLDGEKDENVFDIMQGVSIIIAVKNNSKSSKLAHFHRSDIYGKRGHKFSELNSDNIQWTEFSLDKPFYNFAQVSDVILKNKYYNYVAINKLFLTDTLGFQTHRDAFAISSSKENISIILNDLSGNSSDEELFMKYSLKNNRDWQLNIARKRLNSTSSEQRNKYITEVAYRPFDNRYTYYDEVVSDYPRSVLKQHVLNRDNVTLSYPRQVRGEFAHVFINKIPSEANLTGNSGINGAGYIAPLWLYHHDGTRTSNFNNDELSRLTVNLTHKPSPEDVFYYIYAILHSPGYRKNYIEFLRNDFPRIPHPATDKIFLYYAKRGKELRELHLMESPLLANYSTTFPKSGSDIVELVNYSEGKVWINNMQYFGNVPELAWRFPVGGYQPAQKWLKDRKGRKLSNQDLDHYQKIIKILLETDRIMKEIE